MKIAMFTNNYKPFLAGVPVSVDRLSTGLRHLGHEVTVFAPSYPEQTEEEGVYRYHSFIRNIAGGAVVPNWLDPEIDRQFRKGGFDLIHAHHPFAVGCTAARLSRKYDVPLVFTYHTRYEQYLHYTNPLSYLPLQSVSRNRDLSAAVKRRKAREADVGRPDRRERLVAAYLRHFTSSCAHVFAPTEGIRQALQDYGCRSSVSVLPTGLPQEMFMRDEKQAAQLRSAYAGGKKYVFCTIARLAKEKNLSFLLQAMAQLRREKGDCFTWLVLGEGPERDALEKEAERLGIAGSVAFLGNRPNAQIPFYLQASDAFLFSSLTETQGIVILEAMAAGIPVAAVRADGVRDIVEDGRNGVLSALDQTEFLKNLDLLLEPTAYPQFREGAYQTAVRFREEFVANKAAVQYERVVSDYKISEKYDKLTEETVPTTGKGVLQWKRIIF